MTSSLLTVFPISPWVLTSLCWRYCLVCGLSSQPHHQLFQTSSDSPTVFLLNVWQLISMAYQLLVTHYVLRKPLSLKELSPWCLGDISIPPRLPAAWSQEPTLPAFLQGASASESFHWRLNYVCDSGRVRSQKSREEDCELRFCMQMDSGDASVHLNYVSTSNSHIPYNEF